MRREVVRVITPGTATSLNVLEPKENNYLAAIFRPAAGSPIGFAYADVTTGEFCAAVFLGRDADEKLRDELHRLRPREISISRQASLFCGDRDGDRSRPVRRLHGRSFAKGSRRALTSGSSIQTTPSACCENNLG